MPPSSASRGDPTVGARYDADGQDTGNLRDDAGVDRWLVDKAKEGDADAFEALVRRHRGRAYRIALRIVGSPHDAQDVTQDVLIQLWGSLAGFSGSSAFSTWLYRMVVNKSLNHRRKNIHSAAPVEADPPTGAGPAEVVIARQRSAAAAQAIAQLPDDQRSVFVLHQMEGFTYAEVAAILGVPEPTVRGRLARGRKALLDSLREWA